MKEKINVFIIDDSEENNFYVEDLISENERVNEVTCFLDPEEALETLIKLDEDKKDLPDLILLDVRMPELDGFELIDEIDYKFDEFKPIVIILTSSKHRKDTESFDKQKIAKDFLNKPLEIEAFNDIVQKYC